MRHKTIGVILTGCLTVFSLSVYAAETTVTLHSTDKNISEKSLGTVHFEDTQYGLLITPNLQGLTPGLHGFHIHENPTCHDNGMAAGGHLDPQRAGKHLGPYSDKGHLGDLPALYVDTEGKATHPELAPRLKVSDILHHSIIVHQGGDNYSDHPAMGGGGNRIGCGVIG